ncbi:MAG: hypothetical protein C4532_03860 [Candidatus Abyssobacteria bacterium SURF_17]|uniref:Uncharacterized protein n=1 Tax=Candidatus Abyssobacteria bacterium SURF_17 TaxID=2093361 RepID=A0A419F5S5_9BACT|nr:MAG: hypothetical protein C4532_03860 [Candidatus Abyssubacteria bacterium SURF_17]
MRCELSNEAYTLKVTKESSEIIVNLYDRVMDFEWCSAPYVYRASEKCDMGTMRYEKIEASSLSQEEDTIHVQGKLAGLRLNQTFTLPQDRGFMEERILFSNDSNARIRLEGIETGFQVVVSDITGKPEIPFTSDTLIAIPFRRCPTDPRGRINEYSMKELLTNSGFEKRMRDVLFFEQMPSRHRYSEGWAWLHEKYVLCLFSFNQENMRFSVLSSMLSDESISLRFGGACTVMGEPSALSRVDPGESVDLGIMRYQPIKGDYNDALYAYRSMLDEFGCRFPERYNPPVHWNELYDNPEFAGVSTPGIPARSRSSVRAHSYTKRMILAEAEKAREFGCEALYLDPGWDTRFGSCIWAADRLGAQKDFVKTIESDYGLSLSLHCALATWLSHYVATEDYTSFEDWPIESRRLDKDGSPLERSVCLGSTQYLEELEKRLLKCCEDGVRFLMLDGNAWNDGCWNPNHGHPVPYRFEDHIRANLHIVEQIHQKYPKVLIELHDCLAGGSPYRMTPIYYKYGLKNSFDENWGFELMWDPFEDLESGRAKALYYYNMACNIPLYLHIDLRTDNMNCIVFWWYASTCRHLGIGGTHERAVVSRAQIDAMKTYRRLERFFKRGIFLGISEDIHLHVLPAENAFVLNIFNPCDEKRYLKGMVPADRMRIDPDLWYIREGKWGGFDQWKKDFVVECEMEPWSTHLSFFRGVSQ